MADETIKGILLEMGLFSLALAYVGGEAELMRMFRDDFSNLKAICQKG
jgi:hypothetical protein